MQQNLIIIMTVVIRNKSEGNVFQSCVSIPFTGGPYPIPVVHWGGQEGGSSSFCRGGPSGHDNPPLQTITKYHPGRTGQEGRHTRPGRGHPQSPSGREPPSRGIGMGVRRGVVGIA